MSIIKTKHLSYHYIRHDEEGNVEGEVPAVKDVNLSVEPGEFIAILGHNGSGKSTLAKHFNALLLPSEGCIVVDGMDTADEIRTTRSSGRSWRRMLASDRKTSVCRQRKSGNEWRKA